jgi:hypothetical protein
MNWLTEMGLCFSLCRYCATFPTEWGVAEGDPEEVWWRLAPRGILSGGYEPNFKAELPQGDVVNINI